MASKIILQVSQKSCFCPFFVLAVAGDGDSLSAFNAKRHNAKQMLKVNAAAVPYALMLQLNVPASFMRPPAGSAWIPSGSFTV